MYNQKIKRIWTLVIFLMFLVFSSCSQNPNGIAKCDAVLIYDYSDFKSFPTERLSIFVEAQDSARKYVSFTLTNESYDFYWNIQDLVVFKTAEKVVAGYPNIKMPVNKNFNAGTYKITFVNADGKLSEEEIKIKKNYDFTQVAAKDVDEVLAGKSKLNYISVFNKDNLMIYYGEKNSDFQDSATILENYNEAAYYHDVYLLSDKSQMCIFPKINIASEN